MSISFTNQHGTPLSVCLVWYNPGCPDTPFRKTGWWNLAPGQGVTALNGPYRNRYFYFYAEASDGSWWGDPRWRVTVTNQAFDRCASDIIINGRVVPLIQVDTGGAVNFTVNLT